MAVAAAVQRQIVRDFSPAWGVSATVEPFARLDQVPTGYWPIVLRDDAPSPGALGMHLDNRGQPLSVVQVVNIWSVSASHEAVEMLADPYGNRFIPGGSLRPGQGVEYLVEVADPVQSVANAYSVNGILVSDFVTPEYFQDPVPVAGTTYSFTGAVRRPRDVADGGTLTWRDPMSTHWWQAERDSGRLVFADLGVLQGGAVGLRRLVDDKSAANDERLSGVPSDSPVLVAARERLRSELAAGSSQAGAWERVIGRVVSPARRSDAVVSNKRGDVLRRPPPPRGN
jgi:hypothetical protein